MAIIVLAVLIGVVVFLVGLVMRKRKVILVGTPAALLLVIWFFLASSHSDPKKSLTDYLEQAIKVWQQTSRPSSRLSWTGISSLFVYVHLISMPMSGPSFLRSDSDRQPTYSSDNHCQPDGPLRLRRLIQHCTGRLNITMSF